MTGAMEAVDGAGSRSELETGHGEAHGCRATSMVMNNSNHLSCKPLLTSVVDNSSYGRC